MILSFERGRADAPAGHALVYFTNPGDGATLATYLVVLPIALQLAKYVPPMFAAQLPLGDLQGVGAVPLPPLPEAVESRDYVAHLAELRHDDLIAAGSARGNDFPGMMAQVAEIAQSYAQLYEDYLRRAPAEPPAEDQASDTDTTVSDVIYGLMSSEQKLAELVKLAGQLRYAVDGGDGRQADDVAAEIARLGQHFPPSYDVAAFVLAAKEPGPRGRELSSLYLDRFYKLAAEDYAALEQIDREIQRVRGG
jgi:hypothetical protein